MLNNWTIVGRAGRDPELRYFEDGKMVANFTVALKRYNQEPLWVRVAIWGKQAQVAGDWVKKGSVVGLTGEMDLETYTNSTTGEEVTKPLMKASQLRLLGSKSDNDQRQNGGAAAQPARSGAAAGTAEWTNNAGPLSSEDDVPF